MPTDKPFDDNAELTFQNAIVLAVVQALIGAISPNVQAISLMTDARQRRLTAYFALQKENEVDREEFEEDFPVEVIAPNGWIDLDVRTEIWIGDDWVGSDWPGHCHRMVFARRGT